MDVWEHFEPYEDEDWDVAGRVEEEPGSDSEENPVNHGGFEKPGIVTETEVLAAEVAGDKRLLAMMLALSTGPKSAKELVSLKVYGKSTVKVKKRIIEPYTISFGYTVHREVEREVEEIVEGYFPLPQSTAYRVLKRLRELGLVEAYRGIDRRKRYYRLTGQGVKVAEKLKELILDRIRSRANREGGELAVEDHVLEEEAKKMGLRPQLLVKALGLMRMERNRNVYYILPSKSTW